jgi:hypothetical protein
MRMKIEDIQYLNTNDVISSLNSAVNIQLIENSVKELRLDASQMNLMGKDNLNTTSIDR